MKGLLSESLYCLIPWSNYLKSVGYIEVLNVWNPPVPIIFSLIIHATILLSTAVDVPIYARATGLPLLLSQEAVQSRWTYSSRQGKQFLHAKKYTTDNLWVYIRINVYPECVLSLVWQLSHPSCSIQLPRLFAAQAAVSNQGNPAARHYTGMSAAAERGRLHGLWGCMRGTEVYILHGFQVVRLVKIKESRNTSSHWEAPPTRKTLFSYSSTTGRAHISQLSRCLILAGWMLKDYPINLLVFDEQDRESLVELESYGQDQLFVWYLDRAC